MESLPIQPYDVLMLVVLAGTMLFGAWKGMAWQLASLGSMVVSCVVATRFGPRLAPHISANQPWNRFLAMLILFLATSLVVWLLFRLVAGIIDRVRLREFDRQMGALCGLAKGVLLCLVITFFAVTLSETLRQSVLRSRSGYYTALLIQRATPVLPDEVRDVVGKYLDELDRQLAPATARERPFVEQVGEEVKGRIEDHLGDVSDSAAESPLSRSLESLRGLPLDDRLEERIEAGMDRLEEAVDAAADFSFRGPAQPRQEDRSVSDEPDLRFVPVEVPAATERTYYVVRQISGQPNQTWRVPLPQAAETVSDAIGRMADLADLANKEIWLSRPGAGGEADPRTLPVDWNARTQSVSPATNYLIFSGDRIIIADSSNGPRYR